MTTADMISEVKQGLGNRNDILDARILLWLNWAQMEIAGLHRKRLFPPKRFHVLEGMALFQSLVKTGTSAAHGTHADNEIEFLGAFTDGEAVSIVADYYNGWVCECGSESKVIYDFATPTATLFSDWTTVPNTSVFSLYKSYYDIGTDISATDIFSIEALEDAETGTPLVQVDWTDLVGRDTSATGTPTKFARRGTQIIFDLAPDALVSFRMFYYKYPANMTTPVAGVDNTSVLPAQLHEGLVLGAIFRGFSRLMEPAKATEARSEFIDFVTNMQDEFGLDNRRVKHGMRMVIK